MSDKSPDAEEQYFARIDKEKKAAIAAELAAAKAGEDKVALQALHHLRCGKCGEQLAPQTFRGVEIDLCGACGAVLLDPGELEQLAGEDESGVVAALAGFFKTKKKA